jgi:phage nucleotide-binding protein
MRKTMGKTQKVNPTTVDLDLDNDDLGDELEMSVAAPVEAKNLSIMDFSAFEEGIEDITLDSEEFIKALFYGPNGTGKTTVSGTFPGPRLILDINERGTRALAGTQDSRKRFVDTFDMFQMAYWFLKSGNHPFKTVVLDNVTTLQELAMKFVMGKEADFDASKDMDMPTKRDWGGLSQIMKRWLIDFRNLPMNVVFIAQEKKTNDDDLDSDEVSVFPQVSGSVKAILGAAVDVIGRTYTSETVDDEGKSQLKFCMRIMPNNRYMAKIRLPIGAMAPPSIVNPNYNALQKIMTGQWQPKNKK